MQCCKVIAQLEKSIPCDLAESWDNVGLLIGRKDKEIQKIMVALDPSSQVIDEAVQWKADLLLTHHPLIFSGMKKITTEDFIGKRVFTLIQNDICYYAMHTNFDAAGMADAVAQELKLQECRTLDVIGRTEDGTELGIGKLGKLPCPLSLEVCADYVKEKCGLSSIRLFGKEDMQVQTVALIPGSGKEYIDLAVSMGAKAVITGDIGHHNGLDAVEKGIGVLDAGHYGLEKIFSDHMERMLRLEFSDLEIKKAAETEPFRTIV